MAPFIALLWALTFVVAEGFAIQVGGQMASWAFGGHRPVFGAIGAGTVVFGRLLHHLADPELAWSPADRPSLPGPVAMWATLLVTQLVLVGLVVLTVGLVRHFGVLGKPARRSGESQSCHVERRMGRKSVNRHTAALYGKDTVCRPGAAALGIDVATGARLFAKSEDYILAVGVPGSARARAS